MRETDRLKLNGERLLELHPWMATPVMRLLEQLRVDRAVRGRIQVAWRSPRQQLVEVAEHQSQVTYGYHNVTGPDGHAEAFAVDLIDDDNPPTAEYPWGKDRERGRHFFRDLAILAADQGLTTLVRWGLSASERQLVDEIVQRRDFTARMPIGKDPCHIQPGPASGVSLDRLRQGWRPLTPVPVRPIVPGGGRGLT